MAEKTVAYASDQDVASIAERLLDRTLPKSEWTHAAHCAAVVHLMKVRSDIDLVTALPTIIRSYNEATGTPNSDSSGYHETITQFYLRAISHFLGRLPQDLSVRDACNRLFASAFGARSFPLGFYSRERPVRRRSAPRLGRARSAAARFRHGPDLIPRSSGSSLPGRTTTTIETNRNQD